MASYLDLRGKFNDTALRNRVVFATVVAAYGLISAATPTASDRAWAEKVFANPVTEGARVLMAVLAANKDATVSTIDGATDSTIQAQVDAVVPQLVLASAGA